MTERCKSTTKKGLQCKRKPQINGYCVSHFKIIKKENYSCSICYDEIKDMSNVLFCEHGLCAECLNSMRDSRCPVCRCEMRGKKITKSLLKKLRLRKKEDTEKASEDAFNEWLGETEVFAMNFITEDNRRVRYVFFDGSNQMGYEFNDSDDEEDDFE